MDNKSYISDLRDYAQKEYIPIIRADSERFMDVLMNIHKPLRILEVGTAIGYSSICMAMSLQGFSPDFHIDTIEIDPDMVVEARKNIENCGFSI